mgnify:CR=1 FL=1
MYLARGVLNPRCREVQRDLANPVDLHRTLMKAFPDDGGENPRKRYGVLHRVDQDRRGYLLLYVQSNEKPDFSKLPARYFEAMSDDIDAAFAGVQENPAVRSVAGERARIRAGDRFVFRLCANVTRRILTKSLADGTKQNGKRVPWRTDTDRMKWFERRATLGGFEGEDVRLRTLRPTVGLGKERRLVFAGTIFEGVLVVRDADLFRAALANGIGPGKAFGFGLLSIARAR